MRSFKLFASGTMFGILATLAGTWFIRSASVAREFDVALQMVRNTNREYKELADILAHGRTKPTER